MPSIGVLALQGDFAAHAAAFRRAGVETVEVRRCAQLEELDALVIPGGESTTLLNLMQDEPWFDALKAFHDGGGAMFGTCAGAILLSREVRSPEQPSLGLLDAIIERNAYGRQIDSFETRLEVPELGDPIETLFIRAPRFVSLGPSVEVLAKLDGGPVLVRQGRILAGTFHSELTADGRLHAMFARIAGDREQTLDTRRCATAN
ncbi:MAG: pyridoxal 5'-phosphate synthase glutaminase subunit PdxT [Acidobacteriota bacterium]|nr:pyridoxal 5'-phosphate synthase glutaminase subunit PdxT [Acidobacteriota bacterium]